MNIGYVEALKQYDYDCFIFHDVDLIPEDDRNLYTCPRQPRHMSVAINTMNYRSVFLNTLDLLKSTHTFYNVLACFLSFFFFYFHNL